MSMRIIGDLTGAPTLLVMLPGAEMSAEEFRANGFLDGDGSIDGIDRIAVETGVECYLDEVSVARLHEQVIAPAHTRGPVRIWLVGISLGGMGALLYAQAHPDRIAGVILLAPFIGSRGLIAEVERAGGLRHWRALDVSTAERRLLAWLGAAEGLPDMHLGFGIEDRFAAAHRLLAALLPAERVVTAPGGHDWPTWRVLWQELQRRWVTP
ncbi:MAG: alpha/beta hydrolase [Rhodospirillales bacterium]|nr:alpha/beta hydrolase [Rhodospirillales bacterium]